MISLCICLTFVSHLDESRTVRSSNHFPRLIIFKCLMCKNWYWINSFPWIPLDVCSKTLNIYHSGLNAGVLKKKSETLKILIENVASLYSLQIAFVPLPIQSHCKCSNVWLKLIFFVCCKSHMETMQKASTVLPQPWTFETAKGAET